MLTYWMLECYGPEHEDRASVWQVMNDRDYSWNLGRRFEIAPAEPFNVEIEGGLMMPMFHRGILLFSNTMLAVLKNAGVDNLDSYRAVLVDIETGEQHENYLAVNIIGLVAAADLDLSEFTTHSANALIDTDFDSLTIAPARACGLLMFRLAESVNGIVVHDTVKRALETAGIQYLDFVDPKKWIG